jgi:hypothetical protein
MCQSNIPSERRYEIIGNGETDPEYRCNPLGLAPN